MQHVCRKGGLNSATFILNNAYVIIDSYSNDKMNCQSFPYNIIEDT